MSTLETLLPCHIKLRRQKNLKIKEFDMRYDDDIHLYKSCLYLGVWQYLIRRQRWSEEGCILL